jgi:transcriptional regulator with XRE-family HTH domain
MEPNLPNTSLASNTRPRALSSKRISPIDETIGKKLLQVRLAAGLSRKALSAKLRITSVQLQKYEKGLNRISASRLVEICQALRVPMGQFFQDIEYGVESVELPDEKQRMCMEISKNFMKITKPNYQQAVSVLAKVLANG